MNKYVTLGFITMFLILITYFVDITTAETVTGRIAQDINVDNTASVVSLLSMLKTFGNLATFSVEGLPVIINFILFYPLASALMYMLVDILKDLIPFT
jgi:hypothetical protein